MKLFKTQIGKDTECMGKYVGKDFLQLFLQYMRDFLLIHLIYYYTTDSASHKKSWEVQN